MTRRVLRDSILIGATQNLNVSKPQKILRQDICLAILPNGCIVILMIVVQIISELLFLSSSFALVCIVRTCTLLKLLIPMIASSQ